MTELRHVSVVSIHILIRGLLNYSFQLYSAIVIGPEKGHRKSLAASNKRVFCVTCFPKREIRVTHMKYEPYSDTKEICGNWKKWEFILFWNFSLAAFIITTVYFSEGQVFIAPKSTHSLCLFCRLTKDVIFVPQKSPMSPKFNHSCCIWGPATWRWYTPQQCWRETKMSMMPWTLLIWYVLTWQLLQSHPPSTERREDVRPTVDLICTSVETAPCPHTMFAAFVNYRVE